MFWVSVLYKMNFIRNVCETLYVAESEGAEEGDYGSDTLDSQSELKTTFSDRSRRYPAAKFIR